MNEIQIGGFKIGLQYRPFIVAEMSGNHNRSFERALEIIEAAAKAGVQALERYRFGQDIKGACGQLLSKQNDS